jgi:transcriptional regulator with XRE-family HTH domain
MELVTDFSPILRDIRAKAGITQSELARRLRTTISTISRNETGLLPVRDINKAQQWAAACGKRLNVTVENL